MLTLELLKAKRAAMSEADVPNNARAQEHAWNLEQTLDKRIALAAMAEETLREVDPEIAELTKQRETLVAIRTELYEELMAVGIPSSRAGVQRHVGIATSVRMIEGKFNQQSDGYPASLPLLEKSETKGYPPLVGKPLGSFLGSLPTIEARLTDLNARRRRAEEDLEVALAPM